MRTTMLVMMALLSAGAAIVTGAGPAAAREFPYCMQGRELGIPGDCSFQSYGECKAAASGRAAYCSVNPAYEVGRPQRGRRYRDRNRDY